MACWVCRHPSLNPCFSGGWSRSSKFLIDLITDPSSLNPCFSGGWSRRKYSPGKWYMIRRLNPCFSGGWSRSLHRNFRRDPGALVLILVLVEDGLGALRFIHLHPVEVS